MPSKHRKGKRKRGGGDGGGKQKQAKLGQESDGEDAVDAAVDAAVQEDLAAAREAARRQEEGLDDSDDAAENGTADAGADAEPAKADPYLLADATYIQKDTRWKNKQRTLVFCSRGVTSRYRHLCEDIRRLLPHHKTEPKFEKRADFREINEICEMKSCNNVVFFEARKKQDLYMWLARTPSGPTMKFQVLNIHTTAEVRLAGNCLHGSRPILHFDQHFSEISYLKLMKELFTQALGTPRNHPKSKPFHDHVFSFHYLDKKIWFRHYQIQPETELDKNDPERQQLIEIGPRFVLDPIRIMSGSFSGQTMYLNPFYMSPTALRSHAKKLLANPYMKKLQDKADLARRIEENREEEDPLDEVFK